jgi:serine/threonine protein kinase/tetratricopeptide (TPR) repeat protein
VGAPPESDREAIPGFDCLHRVAQSYLGPLWIASDAREGASALRLLRRLQLPEDISTAARSEIAALGQKAMGISHPNVLRVLEVVERGPQLVMVYDHAEAEPLRSLQSWANLRGLSFPVSVALRIVADLLEGLAAVHELGGGSPGLALAGGLSPDSVLVSRDGRTQHSDPLIANGAALLAAVGFNTAKLAYAAPEQVHASSGPTQRADLFTCAAMLWELLASRRLLAGSRPAIERKLLEHNLPSLRASLRGPQQVSDELVALVERALSADPASRPESASAFARQLGECGHELAPLGEVAAFVGKLSGPRFDRRSSAIRSRANMRLDELKLPNELPSGSSGRRGASDSTRNVETPRGQAAPPSSEPTEVTEITEVTEVSGELPEGLESASAEPSRLESFAPTTEPASVTQRSSLAQFAAEPPRPTPRATGGGPDTAPRSVAASPFAPASSQAPLAAPPVAAGGGTPAAPRAGAAKPPASWQTLFGTPSPPGAAAKPGHGLLDIAPFGGRTMTGLGGPHHPALSVNQPFANLTPSPFAAVAEPDERAEPHPPMPGPNQDAPVRTSIPPFGDVHLHATSSGSEAEEGPLPFQHLLPRSKRGSQRPSIEPGSQSWFELQARPAGAGGGIAGFLARQKLWVGVVILALVASGGYVVLAKRDSGAVAAVAERPAPNSPPDAPPSTSAGEPPDTPTLEPSPSAVAPKPSGAPLPAADAGALEVPAPAPPSAAEIPRPTSAADFAAAKLDDSQLVVLFELEERTTLPSCAERLGDKRKYTGNDMRRSQLQLKAAQRKLASGDAMEAHELACSAVAHSPRNPAAQRTLAELALQLGDPAQAKTAIDKALARTPKDKSLIALRGDALALMGDIAGSRSVWLRTGPVKGTKTARTKKLVSSYDKLGAKALLASSYAEAAALFRRVVILTHGAVGPSLSLSEALLGLERSRAALVWAERAAQAFPKNARMQVLFGDALFENGQNDKARAAWQAALDLQPANRVAARRLREGKP